MEPDDDTGADVSDSEQNEERELRDLDPNAEDEARKVERQLRRVRRESRG
ncbi:hypothetical protein [Halorussus amylolyticus]|nr:hypothetical protein [Halorussus amylolyticus]